MAADLAARMNAVDGAGPGKAIGTVAVTASTCGLVPVIRMGATP